MKSFEEMNAAPTCRVVFSECRTSYKMPMLESNEREINNGFQLLAYEMLNLFLKNTYNFLYCRRIDRGIS